jgi:hypothetical protein
LRKVASLADAVKRRVVPLARWSERRWGKLERAYGARKLAAPQRATFRAVIGRVVVLYEQALAMPKEPSGKELRDARTQLAAVAENVAAFGFGLVEIPGMTEPLGLALVRICLGEITLVGAGGEVLRPPLLPGTLRDLATMLRSRAWRYRPGGRGDFALMEFVSRLDRLSVAVCGVKLTLSVHEGHSADRATYGGSLLEVVQLLQPALPRGAGSIAEDSESKLGPRLRRARDAYRRPQVTPIP